MNRRDSLKVLGLTSISTAILLDACKPGENKVAEVSEVASEAGRQDFEIIRDKKLHEEKFFTEHEMATITVLSDLIIPKDDRSGSASEAKVPEFIGFIVKDIPSHQTPMRGGLRWLDMQCFNRYQKSFIEASDTQKIDMLDAIAYPNKAKPGMEQGVAFFNLMRNLTASGFFTTEMGVKDIGYAGNVPNKWEGVPADVLKQYGMENVKI